MAIGFGAQQVVGDVLAGFFLFAERQFGVGDLIRLSMPGQTTGVSGTVEELTLRVTKLRSAQGDLIVVPNSALRQVTNLSKDWSRVVIDIPIPAEEDLDRVTGYHRRRRQRHGLPWTNGETRSSASRWSPAWRTSRSATSCCA